MDDVIALLDLTDWAYFSLDTSGHLIEVSTRLAQLLSSSPGALAGLPLASLFIPPHGALLSEHLFQTDTPRARKVIADKLRLFLSLRSPFIDDRLDDNKSPLLTEGRAHSNHLALTSQTKTAAPDMGSAIPVELVMVFSSNQLASHASHPGPAIEGLLRPIPSASSMLRPRDNTETVLSSGAGLQRLEQQLRAIRQLGQYVATCGELQSFLSHLVSLLHQDLGYCYVDVFWLTDDKTQAVLRASSTSLQDDDTALSSSATDTLQFHIDAQEIVGLVASSAQSLLVNDLTGHPQDILLRHHPDVKSALAVPLMASEGVVGVLAVQSDTPDALTLDDTILLHTLADFAAIAVENAFLLGERDQRLAELAALNQIGMLLASPGQLVDTLDAIIRRVNALFQVEAASLILVEDGRLHFKVAAGTHIDQIKPYTLEIGQGIAGWVVQHNQTIRANDVRNDPRHYAGIDQTINFDTRSLIAAPLRIAKRPDVSGQETGQERVSGVVEIMNRLDGRPFTRNDEILLEFIASSAAVVIENVRLFNELELRLDENARLYVEKTRLHEETSRRLAEVSTLYMLANQITTVLDLDRILETTVTILNRALDCQGCCLYLYDPQTDDLALKASSGRGRGEQEAADMELIDRVSHQVLHDRQPINLTDIKSSPGAASLPASVPQQSTLVVVSEEDKQEQGTLIRSLLVVPLITQNAFIGTLSIDDRVPEAFGPGEGRLLTIAAAQVAVAIENARLLRDLNDRAIQLEQALREMRELHRLKTEFVQNLSHELRTPLTFVKSYVQLILEEAMGEINPDLRRALSIVDQRTEAVIRLVNDVISLERVEMGKFEPQLTSLVEVATRSVEGAAMTAKKSSVSIELQAADDLPLVFADPGRMGQVFDNLLGNAIKFSPAGSLITVRVWRDEGWVRADLEDQGIGIPADKLDQIFDRFYQVDGSTTRRYGGTGLGLAIVKTIVEAHGGRVTVESEVGVGSTFSVLLPIPPITDGR